MNVILVSYERRFIHIAYHLLVVLEVQRRELRHGMQVVDMENLVATLKVLDQGVHAAVESVLRDDELLSIEVGSIRVQWMADVKKRRLIDHLPLLEVVIHEEDVNLDFLALDCKSEKHSVDSVRKVSRPGADVEVHRGCEWVVVLDSVPQSDRLKIGGKLCLTELIRHEFRKE